MLNNFFLSAPPPAAFQSLEQNLSAGPVCPPGLQAAEIRSCSAERGFHSGRRETQPLPEPAVSSHPASFVPPSRRAPASGSPPPSPPQPRRGAKACAPVYIRQSWARAGARLSRAIGSPGLHRSWSLEPGSSAEGSLG